MDFSQRMSVGVTISEVDKMPTDQEKDKLIVEALGECWHDAFRLSIPLATPSGFFWWWERAKKMEWWDDFIRNFTYHDYLINLVDLTRGRDDLYKFLVERSKGR